MSEHRLPPSRDLHAWIEARRPFPPHVAYIEKRYAAEPYRLVLSLLAGELADASRDDMTTRLVEREEHRARVRIDDLLVPVEMVAAQLPASLARDEIERVQRQLRIFGLQSMRLDIREESGRLNSSLGEILQYRTIEGRTSKRPPGSCGRSARAGP